ncbi:VWA domain-containing protein [Methylomonas rhizoryzae]|uniref:VWA domain-containing protein n=1 Tax=Methylomonas rhizoryzae TaxID=2608981 RepID=UPI001680A207|nr:VWA domain-containing protein [Methylomonas rhizoryzae]
MFRRFETRFALLDALPDSLYSPVVTHSHGELLARSAAVLHWRACLLAGQLPEPDATDWPERNIRHTILMRLETLEIVQYCRGQAELTDSILLDLLEGIGSAEDYFALKPDGFVDKLAQRQKIKNQDSSFADPEGLADHVERSGGGGEPNLSSQAPTRPSEPLPQANNVVDESRLSLNSLPPGLADLPSEPSPAQNENTDGSVAATPPSGSTSSGPGVEIEKIVSEPLERNWRELAQTWQQLSAVYAELGGLLGRGWDLTQGVLAVHGWRDIVRYRRLLQDSPELVELIALIGRLRRSIGTENLQALAERIVAPLRRPYPEPRPQHNPHPPMETGGIELDDDLTRMLPSELSQLGHPKLKWLWHARRAERRLLTYCRHGLLPEPLWEEQDLDVDAQCPPQVQPGGLGAGPIIVCLDTSASMHGAPETIAKAIVLEVLRLAYAEHRACHIYAFSGPQQILEHELDLTRGGLKQLLQFLQHSFHGGTDVVQPLLNALAKQHNEAWLNADILLITDGRFPLQAPAFERIEALKRQQGLRIHGLLLGNWRSRALEALCEPLHRFNGMQSGAEELD